MRRILTVACFGESTEKRAKEELRRELNIQSVKRNVTLKGKPKYTISKKMENWYNGEATQEVE